MRLCQLKPLFWIPFACLLAFSAPLTQADTFTVTSTADTGDVGTLRWAITQANANPGSTIILQDNLGTITFTAPAPPITAATTLNGGSGNTVNGSLTQLGGGELVLSGAPSFSGALAPDEGTLTIAGAVTSAQTTGIAATGGTATLAVTGSDANWTSLSDIYIGLDGGTGTLLISEGATASDTFALIGRHTASDSGHVTVTGAGSTWTHSAGLVVGTGGTGTMLVSDGGHVSNTDGTIGGEAGSSGAVTVTGANSRWTSTAYLLVGNNGTGTLTVADGGTVQVGATGTGTLTLGNSGAATGTLNIGAAVGQSALAPGVIQAATVTGGSGSGAKLVNFNHTDTAYTFAPNLTGNLSVQQNAGTTRLSGTNTYTGTTTINAGTLQFATQSSLYNGNSADWTAANLTVAAGATATFNVGGDGEFTATDIALLSSLGTASNGFLNGSSIGLDISITDFYYDGIIADPNSGANSLGLVVQGDYLFVLTGQHTYTGGTTINGSGILLNGDGMLPTGGDVTLNGGALDLSSSNRDQTIGAFTLNGGRIFGNRTLTVASLSGNGVVLFNDNNSLTSTQTGDTTFSGALSHTILTLDGSGMLTLDGSGNGEHTAVSATVNAGTLVLAKTDIPTIDVGLTINSGGTVRLAGPTGNQITGDAPVVVNTGGTLDLNGRDESLGSLTGGGLVTNTATGTTSTLTLGENISDAFTFSGTMQNGAGTLALTKIGDATLTLTGENTFTGGTTINSGTLAIGDGGTTGSISGNIANHAALTFNLSDASDYAGVISGTGTLTKLGSGTLVLTGDSTYTGATTISAGTLSIGDGGTTGSLTGDITNNNALVFNRSGALVYSGSISGSGSLTKLGSGTLTLSGANTYAGSTTINSGTLQFANRDAFPLASAANLTVASAANAVFNVGGVNEFTSDDIGTLSTQGTFLTGSSLGLDTTHASGGTFALNASPLGSIDLVKLGTGTLALSDAHTFSGHVQIAAGTLDMGPSDLDLTRVSGTGTLSGSGNFNYSSAADYSLGVSLAGSASLTKLGTGTLALTGANTYSGPTTINAGTLQFATQSSLYNGNSADWTAANLTVAAGATATFNVGGDGEFTAADIAHISSLGSASDGFLNGSSIGLTITDFVIYDANLTNPNSGANALGVVLQGGGTLLLTGTNTYTGGTTVNAGSLLWLAPTGTLSEVGAVTLNDGSLNLGSGRSHMIGALTMNGRDSFIYGPGSTLTVSSLSGSDGVVDLDFGSLVSTQTGDTTFSGALSHTLLTLDGSGTLTLDGSGNGYHTGVSATVNAGTLVLAKTDIPTIDVGLTINSGGTVRLAGLSGDQITGDAPVVVNTGGTLDLNGRDESLGSLTGGGTVTNTASGSNSTLILGENFGGSTTFSGEMQDGLGTLALQMIGGGTLTLTGNNTYTGGTTIGSGTLAIGNGGTTGSLTGNITNQTSLIFNRAGSLTYSGSISGSGRLTKQGSGTVTLSGSNTYAGPTAITAGTFQFAKQTSLYNNSSSSWTASNLTVSSGAMAAFNVGGTNEFTAPDIAQLASLGTSDAGFRNGSTIGLDTSNAASGEFIYGNAIANPNSGANAIGLEKLGSGTLVLTAENTYTGLTAVNAGTLLVNGSILGNTLVKNVAILGGSGIIGGNVIVENGGTLSPGNSPGLLTIEGDLTLNNLSVLLMEFGGTTSGLFDQLDVQGFFTAGGSLNLMLIDNFAPLAGTSFQIFTGTSPGFDAGGFAVTTNLGGGLHWDTSALASSGIVSVIPEPGTAVLVALGLGAVAFRRKKRG